MQYKICFSLIFVTLISFSTPSAGQGKKPRKPLRPVAQTTQPQPSDESIVKRVINLTKGSIVRVVCPDLQSTASGFVVTHDGYVLTNNHVVARYQFSGQKLLSVMYSKQIQIVFNDGKVEEAEVANSTDWLKEMRPLYFDYAILKLKQGTYTPLALGGYNDVEEGDKLIFGGFPLSSPSLTFHTGMVSAKYQRNFFIDNVAKQQQIIQVQGSINKGNSGGPLLDADTGKVIGIVSEREGGISQELANLRNDIVQTKSSAPGAGVFIQGVDPLVPMVELINSLDRHISVGIGRAISIEIAKEHLKEITK